MQNENFKKIFNFLVLINNLKFTIRFSEIEDMSPDSSAAHSWRVALTTIIVAEEMKLDIDSVKAVKVALVHDLAEAITGDFDALLVSQGVVTKDQKLELEVKAMKKLTETLPEETGREILTLWQEYENGSSKECKFVKAIDKIETLIHIVGAGHKAVVDSPDFIAVYADKSVKDFPELKEMLRLVKKELKKEYKKSNISWQEKYNSV